MEPCGGRLLIHGDGTPAACTEELDGRACPGMDAPHAQAPVSCEDVLGFAACEVCAPEVWAGPNWSDAQWRHAAHVGQMARVHHFCKVHHGRRRVAAVHDPAMKVAQAMVLIRATRNLQH